MKPFEFSAKLVGNKLNIEEMTDINLNSIKGIDNKVKSASSFVSAAGSFVNPINDVSAVLPKIDLTQASALNVTNSILGKVENVFIYNIRR